MPNLPHVLLIGVHDENWEILISALQSGASKLSTPSSLARTPREARLKVVSTGKLRFKEAVVLKSHARTRAHKIGLIVLVRILLGL